MNDALGAEDIELIGEGLDLLLLGRVNPAAECLQAQIATQTETFRHQQPASEKASRKSQRAARKG